jgi:F-type H+-transporting ATPase subunit gamma
MAERLADIVAQIQNVRQLQAVVTAMRGIAASRAQRSRSLLPGIEAYTDVVSRAIGQALNLLPAEVEASTPLRSARIGLILFCAEQGFAGAFSERVLDAAAADIEGAIIFIIGTRGASVAKERGVTPIWSASMVPHVDGIPSFANQLVDALYGYFAAGNISKVDVIFSRAGSSGGIEIDRHSILPIDFGRFKRPVEKEAPLITLAPELLLERLAAEYVYAQLCEATMHAFEAENEARMMAMLSAKTNIETKLVALTQREHQLRQDEITTEIVELAAGAEALTGHRR